MPELPEVAVFRQYLERTALNRPIEDLAVPDPRTLAGVAPGILKVRLEGRSLDASRRHGKFLFARLDDATGWLAFHFGGSGRLAFLDAGAPGPETTRVLFCFDGGSALAFDCPYRFGYVDLVDRPEEILEEKDQGPDALELGLEGFLAAVDGWGGSVKSILMNQSRLAGVGSRWADEICFQAGVHPKTPVAELDRPAREALHAALRQVLTTAIDCGAVPERLPEGYLLPRRREGASCPRCDGTIVKGRASGRSAFYCSRHQEPGW